MNEQEALQLLTDLLCGEADATREEDYVNFLSNHPELADHVDLLTRVWHDLQPFEPVTPSDKVLARIWRSLTSHIDPGELLDEELELAAAAGARHILEAELLRKDDNGKRK